jgi:hypothetical protein
MTPRHRSFAVAALVAIAFVLFFGGAVRTASAQTISVTSANPPSGEQGALSLSVTIAGKGFKNGAKAKFLRSGTTDPAGINVQSTQYVSATQLIATIKIAADAALSLFDIEVANADGRTGKGTELFKVTLPGAAAPGQCTPDIDLAVTVVGGGALFMDTATPYTAVLNLCSGSNDATLNLLVSKTRRLGFSFPAPIPNSPGAASAPSWIPRQEGVFTSFLTTPFMNVRDLLWGRANTAPNPDSMELSYTFTTRMGLSYINYPGDKNDYLLRFFPPRCSEVLPPAPCTETPTWDGSQTEDGTVPAVVTDFPGTCHQIPVAQGGTLDRWVVTVDLPATAALLKDTNPRGRIRLGQYVMPLQLQIVAKTCVPF